MERENRVYTEEPSQKVSVTSKEPLNKDGEFAFCCEFDHHCPCCRNFAPCTLCCNILCCFCRYSQTYDRIRIFKHVWCSSYLWLAFVFSATLTVVERTRETVRNASFDVPSQETLECDKQATVISRASYP